MSGWRGLVVFGVGAKNKGIAAIGALAQESKSGVLLRTAAHDREARLGSSDFVGFVGGAEIFPFRAGRGSEQQAQDRRGAKILRSDAGYCGS